MRKPGNLLILAIVIGALGAALVYRQLRALRSEIETSRQAPESTAEVVVANEPIPLGTRIEPKHVKVVPWPQNIKPDGAITDPQSVVGFRGARQHREEPAAQPVAAPEQGRRPAAG